MLDWSGVPRPYCASKAAHGSRRQALNAAKGPLAGWGLRPYACDECGRFHLTGQPKRSKASNRATVRDG